MRTTSRLLGLLLLLPANLPAWSQTQGAPPTNSQPYTLNVISRLVIEDVSVTDNKGNPVRGLPGSAFHVTDDKAPQQILSFTAGDLPGAATPDNPDREEHTNATLYRNGGTLVALLIDPVTIELQDQMYLRLQLQRFLNSSPPDVPVAIFRTSSAGIPVLLQSPTTDKALLRNALAHTVPVMTRPVYSTFSNALIELANLADFFRAVPGKKAVLWLAGRFPLYEPPDFSLSSGGNRAQMEDQLRQSDRALEAARIAVYPIDVRGVLMGGLAPVKVIDTAAAANDPSTAGSPPLGESAKISGQYERMDQLADATGGRAFYSNNAVGAVMNTALRLATAAYTLGYRPTTDSAKPQFHKVHITVDGPYTLHYREGYLSGPDNAAAPVRPTLSADGEVSPASADRAATQAGTASFATSVNAPLEAADRPIIFSARVAGAENSGKAATLRIRYNIPESELSFGPTKISGNARFRLAALAYNASGDVLSKAVDIVETHYSPDQVQLAARVGTPADQTVQVSKGAEYLLLAVEDLATGRVGTLQVSLASLSSPSAGR